VRTSLSIFARAVGIAACAVVSFGSAAWAAPDNATSPGQQIVVVSETPAGELLTPVIEGVGSARSYQFAAAVPEGGRLVPADPAVGDGPFATEVKVLNAGGKAIGGYEAPFARDANQKLVPSSYRINGDSLVQTVEIGPDTAFPVAVYLSGFERYESPSGMRLMSHFVGIPSNYIYNTNLKPTTLHDYCTVSPDWYRPVGAKNADFRGPCARHDLCYERPGNHKKACDDAFYNDLLHMCDHTYGKLNPVRYTCRVVAKEYHLGVIQFGDDDI